MTCIAAASTSLVLELVGLEQDSDSSGVGSQSGVVSQFQVLGAIHSKSVLASRRPNPGHQDVPRNHKMRLTTTVCRCSQHT